MRAGWTAIVPVKRWALAKSRMVGGPEVRGRLARAFAFDVIETLGQVEDIEALVIVTDEGDLASLARHVGAVIVEDHSLLSPDPLNHAIRIGRGRAAATRPSAPLVVVPADLPAITVDSVQRALSAMGHFETSFVPDAAGDGTTLLAAARPCQLHPAYGPGSAQLHWAAGSERVLHADQRLRRDVDTAEHLQQAAMLGLGPRTADVVQNMLASTGAHRAVM